MRFVTSQTTPSYFLRRIQLRMLSFVGLIAIIVVTLNVMNRRPMTELDEINRQASDSPESLAYEVHREKRALVSAEFVADQPLENDGPRGQWVDSKSRDDVAEQDRDFFKRRNQEQTRDPLETRDAGFFRRRTIPPAGGDEIRPDDGIRSQSDPDWDAGRQDRSPPTSRRARNLRSNQTQVDDDWGPSAKSAPNHRLDGDPLDPADGSPDQFDNQNEVRDNFQRPIEDLDQPLPGSNTVDPSSQDLDSIDADLPPRSTPTGRRHRNSTPDDDFDRVEGSRPLPGGNTLGPSSQDTDSIDGDLPPRSAPMGRRHRNSRPDDDFERVEGSRPLPGSLGPSPQDFETGEGDPFRGNAPIGRRSPNSAPDDDFDRVDRSRQPLPGSNTIDPISPDFDPGDGESSRRNGPIGRRKRGSSRGGDFDRIDGIGIGDDRRDPIDLRRRDDRWGTPPTDAEPFREDFAAVRIDKQYLDLVKDNTLGIRSDEAEVFYWLLDHARRVSSSALEKAGLREVQYINLMTEPDRFRGEPITIEGDLWRLYEYDAGRNEYGVSRVYEGWVFTGDSGNHPYRIVCTSLPKGIEPGENLRKPVRITGYFFKREGYRSNGGVHVAPVLLARKIGINPSPNGILFTAGLLPHVMGVIMAAVLALLVTIVGFAIGDERTSRDGLQRMRRHPHLSFADLAVPTLIPVEESLRQLAERERESAISGAYGPLLSRQTLREFASYDDSTPRHLPIDDDQSLRRRPANIVQNWAAHQRVSQAEIDALRGTKTLPSQEQWNDGDELNSDKLAPARNHLPNVTEFSQPLSQPESFSFSTPIPVPNSRPVASHIHTVVPAHPTNIDYRASKLSEWEDEVAKMANRTGSIRPSSHLVHGSPDLSAAAQIERDRVAREHEIRDRIHREHMESERIRLENIEKDRIHRERIERERQEWERAERERQDRERHDRDRLAHERGPEYIDGDDRTDFTLASSRAEGSVYDQFERERQERERIEHERLEHERMTREQHERERLEHERSHAHREYDRHPGHIDSHSTEHTGTDASDEPADETSGDSTARTGKHRGGWGWPRKKKSDDITTANQESHETGTDDVEEPTDESASDDTNTGGTSTSTGWGRSRKRRRNWRDGSSS